MRDHIQTPDHRFVPRYAAVAGMVLVITLLHYTTAVHIHEAHGIYRRLYYFPIIIAAFTGGWRAGLSISLVVCALYVPHAFGWIGFDPAPTLEKILEMVLYVAVGLVTGLLVSRELATRRSLVETAAGLQEALQQKRRMQAELLRAARLAAVGRLSAGLAHEIRNPLASIKGAAEVLADDFPPDHPKGRLLQILVDETGRLNNVLTRFLAFARPQGGRRDKVDLKHEVGQVVDLVRHREDLGGTEIITVVRGEEPVIVMGERERIRQLLLNIVLNAAQAAGPEGRVEISLQCGDERSPVVCSVEDDGPGFTAEALENFGTPFFTTKDDGTGLGLAICHRIVEDLDGSIRVANRGAGVEAGASVILELPRAQEER